MSVNFARSTISWGGESHGIFHLKSLLTVCQSRDKLEREVIGLGEAVLAGNVYRAKSLLKQPTYIFQLLGSIHRQWIYRTYISPFGHPEGIESGKNPDGCFDTYGEPLFQNGFDLSVATTPGREIEEADLLCATRDLGLFSAVMQLCIEGQRFVVEFPITHINVRAKDSLWQVETGPVVFPILRNGEKNVEFLPCFLHFNRLDQVDVFFDYPFGRRSEGLNTSSVLEGVDCEVKLYILQD